jgi:hypothetical protein
MGIHILVPPCLQREWVFAEALLMIDLLATSTANAESGVLSCRKWAEDWFSSSSVHPVCVCLRCLR